VEKKKGGTPGGKNRKNLRSLKNKGVGNANNSSKNKEKRQVTTNKKLRGGKGGGGKEYNRGGFKILKGGLKRKGKKSRRKTMVTKKEYL